MDDTGHIATSGPNHPQSLIEKRERGLHMNHNVLFIERRLGDREPGLVAKRETSGGAAAAHDPRVKAQAQFRLDWRFLQNLPLLG